MISEFSMLGIGQDQKLFIFLLKPHRDLLLFGHLSNFNYFIIVSYVFVSSVSKSKIKEGKKCEIENRKIKNSEISGILFTSNFDTGCNSRFKNAKEIN